MAPLSTKLFTGHYWLLQPHHVPVTEMVTHLPISFLTQSYFPGLLLPNTLQGWSNYTEHGVGDGEGDGWSPSHPPAAAQVGEVRPQHLHNHLVVKSQVELLLVYKL